MWWLSLACTAGQEPALRGADPIAEPTVFAVGERWDGEVMGANPFLGSWFDGTWSADVRDLSSPTAATEAAQAFTWRAGLPAISTRRGRHTVDVGDLRKASGNPGETLIDLRGEPVAGHDTTLVWTTELPVEHLVGGAAPKDAIRAETRRPLLDKVYALEAQEVECEGEHRRYEATVGEPVATAAVLGHAIVQWPVTFSREGEELPGSALFLEAGGPVRSSATAPYMKLCGNERPIGVNPELSFRIEGGPPMLLTSVHCGCNERRFAILDLELGEAVLWSW